MIVTNTGDMENKIKQLLKLVPCLKLWEAEQTYWMKFTDAYETRILHDTSVESLVSRAIALAKVSARSKKREEQSKV